MLIGFFFLFVCLFVCSLYMESSKRRGSTLG